MAVKPKSEEVGILATLAFLGLGMLVIIIGHFWPIITALF